MGHPKVLEKSPFVGREQELNALHQALDFALEGKGTTIFITGEAGSGKTRLSDEFVEIAKEKNVTILTGWCNRNAPIPYFPFLEALNSYQSKSEENDTIINKKTFMKTLLTSKNQIAQDSVLTLQAWKDQTFAAITQELLSMSTVKPLILILEDVHWADSASLFLLHNISRAIMAERILLIVTFRNEEFDPVDKGNSRILIDTFHLMGREDLFTEIKITKLTKENISKIAESMLGGEISDDLAEKLASESAGNPLFVVESLKMLFENQILFQKESIWRLSVDKLAIPVKVKEIILRRILALKPHQRRILDVASVIGDMFDPDLIGSVLNKDSIQILEALNSISQSNSLVYAERNFFRFDHAKSREVLYEEIRSPLKKGYHNRIAEKIEANTGSKQLPVNDLAYHYIQAENTEKAIKYSLFSGKDALLRFSNEEAIKHFTYVLEHLKQKETFTSEKESALEGLGDALYSNSMFNEALKTYKELSESSNPIPKLRAFRKAIDTSWFLGNISQMTELLNEAEKCGKEDRLEQARILQNKARISLSLGKRMAATKEYELAVEIFEQEYALYDSAYTLVSQVQLMPQLAK